jgi:hypothetical protein
MLEKKLKMSKKNQKQTNNKNQIINLVENEKNFKKNMTTLVKSQFKNEKKINFQNAETEKIFKKKLQKKKINEKQKNLKNIPKIKIINQNEMLIFKSFIEDMKLLISKDQYKEEDFKKINENSKNLLSIQSKLGGFFFFIICLFI